MTTVRSSSLVLLLVAAPAFADDTDTGVEKPTNDAATTVDAGDFVPLGVSPKTPSSHAQMVGGYDTARGGAVVETKVEAKLHDRFEIMVAGRYEGPTGMLEPRITGQLGILDEKKQRLDLSVSGGWERQGFNGVPAVTARIAAGHHIGDAYVAGSTAMGFGINDNERYGELTLSGLGHVAPHVYAGLDARGRLDLQHDTDPSTEDAWAVQAGPVASVAAGPVAVTGFAGVSARRQHTVATDDIGAITMLGLGAVF
ncbi:MAG: hypothetical protein JO257_35220 [Deltaproteobacteria bacterium]|nr:hypothetical protein [Deltaproteobacteria bacterium]